MVNFGFDRSKVSHILLKFPPNATIPLSMKKTLSLVVVLSVLFFGVVGALSVIPHVHGKDFNHSQHETCPVYQFGVSNVHADVSHVAVIITLFLFCFLIEIHKSLTIALSRSFAHLRAPPVVS